MKDILCSKLYLSSSRKDKILAAIQDPNNRELVQQVASYLDDEFIDKRYLDPDSSDDSVQEKEEDSGVNEKGGDDRGFSGGGSTLGGGFSSSGFSSMDDIFDDESGEGESSDSDEAVTSDETDGDTDDIVEEPVIESSKSIKASLVLDVVKGTLNARQDTAGVDRVVEKENELWVYYNDNINLNKVMSEAAQELILQGYSMLEFNRLARSNNAIVFDIVKKSSGGA